MERKDATSLAYDEIKIFGMPALFTNWRVIRDTVPKGMTLYELRHEDENWGKPCQVAKRIVVNYYGSILTSLPIQLNPDGGRDINRGDFRHKGERSISIQDFLEKNPVAELDVMNLSTLDRVEENLFFSMDEQADRRNGCIGHFRGDFGNGKQFFHDWFPHQGDKLNHEPFKSDFQRVVDWLRQDYSPLKDLDSMKAFCRRHEPYSKMEKAILPSHGFRIDTQRFQYMLRCFPQRGDYNFYIYCYDKQAREQERTEPKKNTRPTAKKRHEPER